MFPQGKDLIVYIFCLVWAADVGAYVTGRLWGKHKLIPQVSPGKSVEGALGGLASVLIISLLAYFYFKPTQVTLWFLLAGLISLISIVGDLFISILKRRCHVKDTGRIFPGHGGILDRFDSLIAVLPVYYLGMRWILIGG